MELQEALLELIREGVIQGRANKGKSNGVDCLSGGSRVGKQYFRLKYEKEDVSVRGGTKRVK